MNNHAILMTDVAINKVHALLKQENNHKLGFRILVGGGGCSELQYAMSIDEEQEGDVSIDQNDFKIFVDDLSIFEIIGQSIDYVDGNMGAGFIVQNKYD